MDPPRTPNPKPCHKTLNPGQAWRPIGTTSRSSFFRRPDGNQLGS